MTITVGNAPVSYGIYGPTNQPVAWSTFLDGLVEAGYSGTELGPYGYFPTDPKVLGAELGKRKLKLGSSYVGLPLEDAGKRAASVAECLQVARLLATQGVTEVIVADDDHDERMAIAGRAPRDGKASWKDAEWKEAIETLHAIGKALRQELKMNVVVHHHVGTMLETPEEIDRLITSTDPELVNLLLDTGHYVYGGGDPLEVLKKHPKRVTYVHLKDVKKDELHHVRTTNIHMRDAWKRGVFIELGKGVVAFPQLVEQLRKNGYSGWAIVEQDVVADANGKLNPDPTIAARASRQYLKQHVGI
ncbi:MAG: TIM barrel protein [Myxococcaceae bacterium]|nr:TIM barrel protein [Myxococcaceae bacterium]